MSFTRIPDFAADSYRRVCPLSGVAKQAAGPGKQPHEVDPYILRGPRIVFESGGHERSLGCFDIRPAALLQAALEHCDVVEGPIHRVAVAVVSGWEERATLAETQLESALTAEAFMRDSLGRAQAEIAALKAERDHLDADLQFANGRLAAAKPRSTR